MHVLFFVEWCELPPLKQTAISDDPFVPHAANVLTIVNMLWTKEVDATNHRIELTEAKDVKTFACWSTSKNVEMVGSLGTCTIPFTHTPRVL